MNTGKTTGGWTAKTKGLRRNKQAWASPEKEKQDAGCPAPIMS
ncbi:hypothetical protein NC99_16290 [Sunxiuqinia dokdonensis]|uniref:Uncharacterized protein n=1 Tax=Sunxiuqinia dokdonensis TaxID=1409788 RepID=A0A0L8VAR6_9BACT|nr:hypothetical protein NC99_16290 [Sunxiuqinia dokdonensis]